MLAVRCKAIDPLDVMKLLDVPLNHEGEKGLLGTHQTSLRSMSNLSIPKPCSEDRWFNLLIVAGERIDVSPLTSSDCYSQPSSPCVHPKIWSSNCIANVNSFKMKICSLFPPLKLDSCSKKRQYNRPFFSTILPCTIFAPSAAVFVLNIKYLDALSNATLTTHAIETGRLSPSHFRLGFYTVAVPFLSLFQSLFVLVVHHFCRPVRPPAMMVMCAFFTAGWLVQWSIWMSCEVTALGLQGGACPQRDLVLEKQIVLTTARVTCGGLVWALYAVGFGIALRAYVEERRKTQEMNKAGKRRQTQMIKWTK